MNTRVLNYRVHREHSRGFESAYSSVFGLEHNFQDKAATFKSYQSFCGSSAWCFQTGTSDSSLKMQLDVTLRCAVCE